jgi:hypothetical protein
MSGLVLVPPPQVYVPILAAFRDAPRCWHVWCPLCRRWHTHAAHSGHREAHCDRERRGYHRLPQPVAHWAYGYVLSDDHPHAHITRVALRPKLPPLGWELLQLREALA